MTGAREVEASESLEAKVLGRYTVGPSGCWLWAGWLDPKGYGRVSHAGRAYIVHRVAYEAVKGPIPEGLILDHLCRVRNCINPDHLEPVTSRENTLRGVGPTAINARKTHCIQGHEFSAENTYVNPEGERYCRTCHAARLRAEYAAAKARGKRRHEPVHPCPLCGKAITQKNLPRHIRALHPRPAPHGDLGGRGGRR